MADLEEENYLDNLLNSLNESSSDNKKGEEGILQNSSENIAGDVSSAGALKESPDFDEPELSEEDMKRLANMNLDNIIDQVKSDTVSVEDLFGGSAGSDIAKDMSSDKGGEAVNFSGGSQTEAKEAAQDVLDTINRQDNADKADKKKAKLDKKEKKKLKNKKTNKKGVFSVIKSVFFENIDESAPEEVAKASAEVAESGVNSAVGQSAGSKADNSDRSAGAESLRAPDSGELSEDKPIDENEKLLREMYGDKDMLDENIAPKKGLFAKLKYRFAQFKKKNEEEEKLEEEAEQQDILERSKKKEEKQAASLVKKEAAQKEKAAKAAQKQKAKAQKPKKEKKPKKPKPEPKPGDILKIKPKSIVLFVMFVSGVIILISMLNSTIHYSNAVSQAKANMENGNYQKAYESLSGMKLNKNDETLYRQACLITSVTRQYESYENFMKMDMKTEAINALVEGLKRYDTYYNEANELGVGSYMTEARSQIIGAFRDTFKISEAEAVSLVVMSEDNFTQYYKKIEAYGKAL